MAVIVQTSDVKGAGNGPVNLTRTVKQSGADTFTFVPGSKQTLHIFNTTASSKQITLVGTAPTPITPSGYGETISTAGGKLITIPADGWTMVDLDDIWAFLTGDGSCTATTGNGCTVALYN